MNASPTDAAVTADDGKIEALVGVILQAVDQRLTTVREQLVELTNSVARSHGALQGQIDECRNLIASSAGVSANDAAHDSASVQLLQAANLLTEQVTFLEARANQYTNDRIAELHASLQQVASRPVTGPVTAIVAPPAAPAVILAPPISAPVGVVAAAIPTALATRDETNGTDGTDETLQGDGTDDGFDLEAFSAQLNARLGALVDGAIGQ